VLPRESVTKFTHDEFSPYAWFSLRNFSAEESDPMRPVTTPRDSFCQPVESLFLVSFDEPFFPECEVLAFFFPFVRLRGIVNEAPLCMVDFASGPGVFFLYFPPFFIVNGELFKHRLTLCNWVNFINPFFFSV